MAQQTAMAKALYSLTSLSSYISLLLCNVLFVLSVVPFLYNDQNHLPTIVDYGPYWLNLIKMDGFPSFVKANFTATLIQFLESGRYYTHIFLAFYVDCSSFLGKLHHSLWVAYWFPVLIVWLIVSPQIDSFSLDWLIASFKRLRHIRPVNKVHQIHAWK